MSETENDTCPHCTERGMFAYRDKATGAMTWYCAAHRLGQYWAMHGAASRSPHRRLPGMAGRAP
jgi:hypothetical protein